MVKFSVAVLSQPSAFVVRKVYVPLVVYAVPFQVYSSHSVTSVLLVILQIGDSGVIISALHSVSQPFASLTVIM